MQGFIGQGSFPRLGRQGENQPAVYQTAHDSGQPSMAVTTAAGRTASRSLAMKAALAFALLVFVFPSTAAATQGHFGPEGLYAHQMAHLFFTFAMGLLIYWLRTRHLIAQAGWRLIQYAALFFLFWNMDAFLVHFLEEQTGLLGISQPDWSLIQLDTPVGWTWLGAVYYLAKLDHLLCVPAMMFLFLGLRRLKTAAPHAESLGGGTSG